MPQSLYTGPGCSHQTSWVRVEAYLHVGHMECSHSRAAGGSQLGVFSATHCSFAYVLTRKPTTDLPIVPIHSKTGQTHFQFPNPVYYTKVTQEAEFGRFRGGGGNDPSLAISVPSTTVGALAAFLH